MTPSDQLALDVEPKLELTIKELRHGGTRELTVGPLDEGVARELAGLLLNRAEPIAGPGPWRTAIAGGTRAVSLNGVGGGGGR